MNTDTSFPSIPIMLLIIRLNCSINAATDDTFSLMLTMTIPVITARKRICNVLPLKKGAIRLAGIMSKSNLYNAEKLPPCVSAWFKEKSPKLDRAVKPVIRHRYNMNFRINFLPSV